MNLEPVQPGSHRWGAFAKTGEPRFVINFEYGEAEGSASGHHWAEEKNSSSRKLLLKIPAMFLQQEPLSSTFATTYVALLLGDAASAIHPRACAALRAATDRLP